MRRLPFLLALGVLPLVAIADSVPRAKMEVKLKNYEVPIRDYSFPSGLRILFEEDHSQPIVSLTSVFDRGSTSDPEGLEGIAHVCEHMWFRSEQKDVEGKPLPKVWDILREVGANLNAYTADDQTVYMTVAPADKLEALMRLEALRIKSPWEGIANETLLTEREVIRNELRMRYENSAGSAFGYLMVKLFPQTHPYGRAAYAGIGSHDSLNAVTLPDVKKFFQTNYRPENTTIVVVGDFKLADTPKLLDAFSLDQLADPAHPQDELKLVPPKVRISGPSEEPPPPVQPLQVKGEIAGLTTEHGAVDKPLLVLAWSLPGGYRETQPLMEIAAASLTSAIRREIDTDWDYTKDQGEIQSLGCSANPQTLATMAYCFIELNDEKKAPRIAEQALDGLYHVWSGDETERQFQQWNFSYYKTYSLAAAFQDVDIISSLSGRATNTANFVHYTGDPLYFSRQFEQINKITADGVRSLAEKYLNRDRAVAVLMLPYEEGDLKVDTSDAQYRGARREDVLNTVMTTEELEAAVEPIVRPPDTSKIHESTLASGVKLVSMSHSNAPLVQVDITFGGGTASTPAGEAYFARSMWTDPSQYLTMNGHALVDPLAIVGFDDKSTDALSTHFKISASAGNLMDALYVLRSRMDNLTPDTNGRIDWVKGRKSDILDWMKYPDQWAEHVAMERLAPNHALSKWYNHADFDEMNKWGANVVANVYQHVLRPDNATIFVVGNVTDEEARQAAETYFGGWSGWGKAPTDGAKPKVSYDPFPEPPARQVVLFNKDNSSQTEVNYICQLGKVDENNMAAAQIVGDALSEDTWLALREQTGSSYGAYAFSRYYRGGPATLGMTSLVQNDTAATAAKVFLELGEKAKAGKISPHTLAVVKYKRAQEYVQGHQSTAQMLNRIVSTYGFGWGSDFFDKYAKRLSGVTNAEMVPLMDRCVGHEVVTAVGPVEVIEPLFAKSGLPYEVFDWKKAKLDYAAKYDLKDVLKAEEKRKKDEEKEKSKKK